MTHNQEFIVWVVGLLVGGMTLSSMTYSIASAFGKRHVDEYTERGSPESPGPEMQPHIHGGQGNYNPDSTPSDTLSRSRDWEGIAERLSDPPLRRAKDRP